MIKPLILNDIESEILKVDKDRYIYGVNQEAKEIFDFLLNKKIFVKGFIDEEYAGCRLYNKKIYSSSEIDNTGSIVFGNVDGINISGVEIYKSIYKVDNRLKNKKIVLYGAGNIGKKVLRMFKAWNLEVSNVIDSDKEKWDKDIEGVKACSKSILKGMDKDYVLVICGRFWNEIWNDIKTEVMEKKVECLYIEKFWGELCGYRLKSGEIIRTVSAHMFQEHYSNKEVILYGRNIERAKEFIYLLKYFDVQNISIVNETADHELLNGEEIKMYTHLEDVLFKNDYVIILYEKDTYKEQIRLNELGFDPIQYSKWNAPMEHIIQYGFDLNLGWTYNNTKNVGVNIHKGLSDKKILVLGGSTSSDGIFLFRSWPQMLYEKLGKQVSIYNCAIDGYSTAQELIKLIRDAVELKPDLVISFDGYNDVGLGDKIDKKFRNMNSYIKKVFHNVSLNTLDDVRSPREQVIWEGISTHTDRVMDYYEKNLEYMNAVCQVNGIKYMSFIQPTFWGTLQGKTSLTKHEKEMSLVCNWEHLMKGCYALRKEAKEIDEKHDYITDLSAIFDEEDVFMDWCHVYEKGNEIIADKIYETIKEKGII